MPLRTFSTSFTVSKDGKIGTRRGRRANQDMGKAAIGTLASSLKEK
jgi:hypothetical protein